MNRKRIINKLRAYFRLSNMRADRTIKRFDKFRNRPIVVLVGVIIGVLLYLGVHMIGLPDDWEFRWLRGTQIAYLLETFTPTASATFTPTATPTATLTPSPTSTPSPTPTPTSTPPEGTPFATNVIGVVLANFVNDAPGEDNLGNPLTLALQNQNIPLIRVQHTILDRTEAQQIAKLYNATIVVWGERYSTGVQVNFEINPTHSKVTATVNNLFRSYAVERNELKSSA
ncbi:MAG TPA: hypothetical protein VHD90_02555 [Phototrophicaceae bacterium]|nr:hypothetical protein [Phototrophicaceae bacterium]